MRYVFCVYLLIGGGFSYGQKVGLVLSGGGATGLAHIGVLKALEEKGIPIDYITGTSAGALVGSLYASGFSPAEIEAYVLSDDFQLMTLGKLKSTQRFLYKEQEYNASMVDISFSGDSIIKKSLPTNFISSSFLDFEMLKILGTTGASYQNNYDSLFVPFRCVASDITHKKSVVFNQGPLNQSVRSSMTFPFYLFPIRVNGTLLFDGGLYNNFPANVMYQEFNPDYIIGSNVSNNAKPPSEDDLISQLTNMLVSYSDYNLPCDEGIIIQPKTDVSTFEFEDVKLAIENGYQNALLYLDSIGMHVDRRVSVDELAARRKAFRQKIAPLTVSEIKTISNYKRPINFVTSSLIRVRKNEVLSLKQLENRYYRLNATNQIAFLYPLVSLKDSTYRLNLEVKKSKAFKLEVGGHFSSRPVNTGFIALSYRLIGKTASTIRASSYFGKFYGSAKVEYTIDFPSVYPVSLSSYFTMNRWDYFRSFATFFEDVKPSFLVQNEMYYGTRFDHPIGSNSKSSFDMRYFHLEDDYYQSENFGNKDTSDITNFDGFTCSWQFVQNSLNRKQFASSGHYFSFKARYVLGKEKYIPGTTSQTDVSVENQHRWINMNAEFQSFLLDQPLFHLGIHGKGVFNSQSLFTNYTASLLTLTSFSLVPDAETYFFKEYRSPQYLGIGINAIISPRKDLDLRFDGYFYQPFVTLQQNSDGTFGYSKPFKGETYMASASIIYHSFAGPIRATVNYFPKQETPFSFQLSFGYVLFNERAIR
jgi:NTE family protein